MSKFSLSVYLNAYSDRHPSNNPGMNNFKWNRDLNSILVNNPTNQQNAIAPGQTFNFFNGTRTLGQDGTTQYSIALKPLNTSTYVLSWVGGTAPNFRTPRTTGADATTSVSVVVNGPIVTFSSFPGIDASFTGQIGGMTTPVTITANNPGTAGNAITLVGDGVSSISTLIANWNIAHPSNQATLTSGNGSQVPTLSAPVQASYTGTLLGTATPVTITAVNFGVIGDITLDDTDGTSTISQIIAAWNLANPTNQVTLTSGDGTQIPSIGAEAILTGGVNPNQLQLSGGVNGGTPFNLISGGVVVGDFVTIGSNFNILNQGTFQIISVTATSFTVEIPTGTNEGPIALGSGFASQIAIFSAAGVQVDDVLSISGGFSPASFGNYIVTAVYANSLEFSSLLVLPQEGPILTESITIYSNAKQLIYLESDAPVNVIVNGTTVASIEQFVIPNAAQPQFPPTVIPGIFLLKSTVWSLSVQNSGLKTANVYMASVE